MINLLLGLGVATTLLTTVAPAKNNTQVTIVMLLLLEMRLKIMPKK